MRLSRTVTLYSSQNPAATPHTRPSPMPDPGVAQQPSQPAAQEEAQGDGDGEHHAQGHEVAPDGPLLGIHVLFAREPHAPSLPTGPPKPLDTPGPRPWHNLITPAPAGGVDNGVRSLPMCLILVAWQSHPRFPLVVAANRDEFHDRPSREAGPWPASPGVLGGLDLEAGGTWLAVAEPGRQVAAVTNVREPGVPKGRLSRGFLPRDFLLGGQSPAAFAAAVDGPAHSGFNLLLADADALWYCSNRGGAARRLGPGIYGVSNHLLDTPWPKLVGAKARFARALADLPAFPALFEILADREVVPDHALPASGVSLEWERLLSAVFVRSERYGTRASTVLTWRPGDGFEMEERRFGPDGAPTGTVRLRSR